jgi:hypothetical protein
VLHAPDLQQEAVLGVEVHRRRRGGCGDEQVARAAPHAALAILEDLLHLVEALVDQLGVLGILLDVAQGDPEAVALDVADRRRRRPVAHVDVAVAVDQREVAALAPDRVRRQPIGELGHRVDREERVVDQRVAHCDRAPSERAPERRAVDVEQAAHP